MGALRLCIFNVHSALFRALYKPREAHDFLGSELQIVPHPSGNIDLIICHKLFSRIFIVSLKWNNSINIRMPSQSVVDTCVSHSSWEDLPTLALVDFGRVRGEL